MRDRRRPATSSVATTRGRPLPPRPEPGEGATGTPRPAVVSTPASSITGLVILARAAAGMLPARNPQGGAGR